MVVKGHHFPNVTLVGVIAADSSLYLEDYRSNERTFQILTQVAGRAGRENEKGNVIIQTYNPENFAIECSKEQNYDMFYETEIELRKQLKYPPFCDIISIGLTDTDEVKIKNVSEKIYKYINNYIKKEDINMMIYKPLPCPIDKLKNRYRWRIIIKGNMTEEANLILNTCLKNIYQRDLKTTRITIDVNPNNMV